MTYRSDLEAAQARAAAAERRATELQREVDARQQSLDTVSLSAASTEVAVPIPHDTDAANRRAEVAEARATALQQQLDEPAHQRDPKHDLPAGPVPERLAAERHGDTLRVQWRWFRWDGYFHLFFFCLIWDAFSFGAPIVGLLGDGEGKWGALFFVPFCAIGSVLTYVLIARTFNRTTVTVTPERLTITHAPIPWRGRDLTREQLRELGTSDYFVEDAKRRFDFALDATLANGDELTLVKRLWTLEEARFLERLIGRQLGMPDRPVDAA